MELYTNIIQLLGLQGSVNTETSQIFEPILAEVERQDIKYLLFPPITDTLSLKWLVRRSILNFVSNFIYLVLKVEPSQETDALTLVLSSHREELPNEAFMAKFGNTPQYLSKYLDSLKTGENHEILIGWHDEPSGKKGKRPNNHKTALEIRSKLQWSKTEELIRIPLNGGTDPVVMANKILTEARRLHRLRLSWRYK
jgi:hypothetical protein